MFVGFTYQLISGFFGAEQNPARSVVRSDTPTANRVRRHASLSVLPNVRRRAGDDWLRFIALGRLGFASFVR